MKKHKVWVITPHQSADYDECWLPCETDADHHAAVTYAEARLEEQWDQYESGVITVTMEQREVDEDEMP